MKKEYYCAICTTLLLIFFVNKPSLIAVGFYAGFITLGIVLLWYIFGKDRHVTPVVNFYPPKNLNAAEVGVIYSEKITKNNYCAFFMQLEQEGYIKINYYSDNDIEIIVLKEYKGNNKSIKRFFEDIGVFLKISKTIINSSGSRMRSFSYIVTSYKSCKINFFNNLKKFRNRLFNKTNASANILALCIISFMFLINLFAYVLLNQNEIILAILNIICTASIPYIIEGIKKEVGSQTIINAVFINFFSIAIAALIFALFSTTEFYLFAWPIIGAISFFFYVAAKAAVKNYIIRKYLLIIFASLMVIFLLVKCILTVSFYSIFLLFCITVSLICLYNMPQKNNIAQRLQGEVLGFRKFLLTVEKPILEKLLKEDKDYCNKMLSYAYSLMIADKWIEKVKNLANINIHYSDVVNMASDREINELFKHDDI